VPAEGSAPSRLAQGDADLDEGYRAMAVDRERERDALEWIDAASDGTLP
jgi:hypothetical protein